MTIVLRILAAFLVLGTIAAKSGWTDTYHIAVVVGSYIAFVTLLVTAQLRARRKRRSPLAHRRPEPVFRSIFVGSLLGFGGASLAGILLWLFVVFHVSDHFYERGREDFERIVSALEAAKSYEAAAQMIEERLPGPISPRWEQELEERMVKDVVEAGRAVATIDEKRRLFAKAATLASTFGIDTVLPNLLLKHLDDEEERGKLASEQMKLQGLLDDQERKRNESESEKSQLQQLLTDRERGIHAAEVEKLLAMGEAQTQLTQRQEAYTAALECARKYGLDCSVVQRRLTEVAAQLKSLTPRTLPASTSIKLVNVRSLPPVHLLELEISDEHGRHICGLLAKDFFVTAKDGLRLVTSVAEDVLRIEKSTRICVAFDHSPSTAGRPLEEAKRGLKTLLKRLNQKTIPIIGFGSTVHRVTDIDAIVAEGTTALYAAMGEAAKVLSASSEDGRLLVVFTDGHNTASGPTLDDVIAQCKSNKIAVHVVALKTNETDEASLTRIANETGGTFVLENVESLAARLAALSEVSAKHVYRLVVRSDFGSPSELRIQVGADESLNTSCDLMALGK